MNLGRFSSQHMSQFPMDGKSSILKILKISSTLTIQNGELSITENQYSDFQFEILYTDLSVEDLIAKISIADFSKMEFSTISEDQFLKGTNLRNLDSEFDALIIKCKQLKIDPRDLEQFIATKKISRRNVTYFFILHFFHCILSFKIL